MSLTGRNVGHIRIEGLAGRGGMGEVYIGYDDALQRRVAIKSISPAHRLSPERKARFLREARALSRLDHPNICKIFDFVESDGDELLILEFIEGASLSEAAAKGIEKADKLRIALEIARVLVVAHGKGIVHRDLKPSNIKLTPEGEVKVLDFGLARFLEAGRSSLADTTPEPEAGGEEAEAGPVNEGPPGRTLTLTTPSGSGTRPSGVLADSTPTEQGAVMGTPLYMSPEQARGERITTASDLFSLGLILQELFTGLPARERTADASTLLGWAQKGVTRPVTGLAADLNALIDRLKAPSPAARPTAVETVERLERIQEKPKRRMRRIIVAGVTAAFVLAGVKYTLDLGRERRQAIQARDEATSVVSFLVNLFSISDPDEARGNTITAREILDKGAKEISRKLEKQPLTRARMMDTIGAVYRKLGLYDQAEPLVTGALEIRERMLGRDHLQVAESLIALASLRQLQGRYQESKDLFRRSLDIRSRALRAEDPLIAEAQLGLGEILFELTELPEAEALYQSSLDIREKALGPDHPDVARSLMDLGWLRYNATKFDEAEALFKRSLTILETTLGPDHPDVGDILANLGGLCLWLARFEESEAYYRRALAIKEKALGPDHPRVGGLYDSIGLVYLYQRRLPEARTYVEKSLAIRLKALGEDHPNLTRCYFSLGVIDHRQGALDRAEIQYAKAIAIIEKTYGRDSPELPTLLGNIADIRLHQGRLSEADALHRRAVAIQEKTYGSGDLRVADALCTHGYFQLLAGRTDEAVKVYERALGIVETAAGAESPRAAEALWGLARCRRVEGRQEEAVTYLARVEALCGEASDIDKLLRGLVLAERAWHLFHSDRDHQGSETNYRKALELMEAEISPGSIDFHELVRDYAALLRAEKRTDEARALEAKFRVRD
jgi:serine/threonine-protein kinase